MCVLGIREVLIKFYKTTAILLKITLQYTNLIHLYLSLVSFRDGFFQVYK